MNADRKAAPIYGREKSPCYEQVMAISSAQFLSDPDLIDAIARAAHDERRATVELLTLLAELDARRLYLGQGCSSLFTYCNQVLHLSEHAAYHRIEAARTARQYPVVLELLAEGALTLTTVALLRPHLTAENHARLLDAARHKTKREVEHQIACLAPQPDVPSLVRKIPEPSTVLESVAAPLVDRQPAQNPRLEKPPRPVMGRIAEGRYLIKVTVSAETHAKLRRALARTQRPQQKPRQSRRPGSRHVPAAIRRAVWTRDQGRCAFEGPHGRCRETGQLEFHHLIAFADGGPTTVANLALRCRAHNSYESEQRFGRWNPRRNGSRASP